jgi:hypothetical protein
MPKVGTVIQIPGGDYADPAVGIPNVRFGTQRFVVMEKLTHRGNHTGKRILIPQKFTPRRGARR